MESSPGAVCGLHEKEDFILAMDDRELLGVALNDIGEIVKVIYSFVEPKCALVSGFTFALFLLSFQEHENKPLILTVFNAQTKVIREVTLVPTSDWPGEGLLGIKLKLTVYEKPIDELNDAADFRSRSKSADTGDAHPEIDGKKPTGRSSFSLA
jgi:hypothetical protein